MWLRFLFRRCPTCGVRLCPVYGAGLTGREGVAGRLPDAPRRVAVSDPREILVRVSYGDLRFLAGSACEAVTRGDWSVLRSWWWVSRENRRRGTWQPFTIGDQVLLSRRRAFLAHWPRRTPRPTAWRHYAQERTPHRHP